jgi:hypothetical protein
MHLNRIAAGFVVAGLCVVGLAACGSGTTAYESYTPSGVASLAQLAPDKKPAIASTCGTKIHIVVGAFIDCKFKEKGYGGNFTILDHTKGLVGISPTKGTKDTTFVVTGLLVGKGYFLVRDKQKNTLKVRVRVTL